MFWIQINKKAWFIQRDALPVLLSPASSLSSADSRRFAVTSDAVTTPRLTVAFSVRLTVVLPSATILAGALLSVAN